MTTQAARVALWVPTVTVAINQVIAATNAPTGAQAPIATHFASNIALAATAEGETDGDPPRSGRDGNPRRRPG